jgi:hypothetical protein
MPSQFPKVPNYNDLLPPIVLAVPHAAGAATLVLPAGAGARLGTLPADRFFRVTALRNPNTPAEVVLGIFKATGISGDALTSVTGDEGFGNVSLPAGTTIEVRLTGQGYEEHSTAINAAEAALAAFAPPTGSLTATAIQALIDARAGTGRAVILPVGTHYLDRPLRINQGLTALLGDPGGGTVLSSLQAGGMPTIYIGPVLSPAPALFDGQLSRWVNLRDTRSGDIDGLATLTIRFDFDFAALPATDENRVILSSGGARSEFGEYHESLRLDVFNGNLQGKFTTASGQVILATPITTGPRHIELIYDGSTVALRVDGSGPSVAATGPVSQGFYEDFVLGSCLARWPDGLCFFAPVIGTMTNFFMDGSGVGNPLFQIPSFVAPGQFVPCETRYGTATLILKKDGNGSASIQHCRVADLQVVANHGHGIFMTQTQASILERLQLFGRQPLTLFNNSYTDSIRDLYCYAWSVGARYGLALINGTCNEVKNINVSLSGPGVGIVSSAASSNFDHCYVIGGMMKLGFLCKAAGFGRWENSIVTDEDQSVSGEAALMFSGVDAVLVDGGGSYALNSPHPLAILDNCKGATFLGHQLGATAATPALFSVAACGPVVIQSCPVVPAGVPYGAGVTISSEETGTLAARGVEGDVTRGIQLLRESDGIPILRVSQSGGTSAIDANGGAINLSGAPIRLNGEIQVSGGLGRINGTLTFGAGGLVPGVTATSNGPTWTVLALVGAPGQSAPLVQYLAADGTTVLASVGPDGSWTPPHLADLAAANDTLYYSTTQGKLCFKIGGVANPLY